VKVTVVRPQELEQHELARWRELQHADERLASSFLSPEFALAVGRGRPGARVAVIDDGDDARAYFAFERGPFGIGRPIGAGICDCQAVVHGPGPGWNAQALLAACGLAVWEFDHLLAYQAPFAPYHVVSDSSPVIDVSDGFGRFGAEHAHLDRDLRRAERLLKRDFGELRFDFDANDRECLGLLMRWKSAQYRRTGRFDRFANRSVVQAVEDLMATRESGCTGTLSVLYAGGKPIATHFGLRSESTLSSWFPAYDLDFAKYRPGLVLLRRVVEASAELGLKHVDLGKGREQYKDDFKNAEIPVAEGWVERPGGVAFLRRLQRTPRRMVMDFVLSRPALRRGARLALNGLGRVRTMG
jgi:CelD/BcsL family acetyltransferase involved in cellulose biosynthesis